MDDSRKISRALPIGTEIESDTDVYTIDSVLGSGGFGVTYKVVRRSDSRVFALKECFPNTLCERAPDNTMSYLKEDQCRDRGRLYPQLYDRGTPF